MGEGYEVSSQNREWETALKNKEKMEINLTHEKRKVNVWLAFLLKTLIKTKDKRIFLKPFM